MDTVIEILTCKAKSKGAQIHTWAGQTVEITAGKSRAKLNNKRSENRGGLW